jgi:transcriptional regulator with XRE-family HTH domain
MASTRDQIISNSAKGLSQVQIARMLGVDESYVSQVVNSDDGKQEIEALAAGISEENAKFDSDLDSAEQVALERIKSRIGLANFQQSLAAFKILNAANRRRDTAPAARQTVGEIHTVVLPQVAVTQYIMNTQSEIIEVEGRTMISASAKQLPQLIQQRLGRAVEERKVELSAEKQNRTTELLAGVDSSRPRRKLPQELDITDLL